MDVEALRQQVQRIEWWHTMDLGHGIVTPGRDRSRRKLSRLRMPEDLTGRTVLDIGAWDGFFSFEAERRGAARVLAVDKYWSLDNGARRAGFDLARRALGSGVEGREMDVCDLTPASVGTFDLVLLLGVLYHLPDPLRALKRVASVTGQHLILETLVDLTWLKSPAVAFYPASETKGDASNWWGPNVAAVNAMLEVAGFRSVEVVSTYGRFERGARAVVNRARYGTGVVRGVQQSRVIVHAWV